MNQPSAPIADVCLVLEGTFPYVSGGVSAWVEQLLRGLPDLQFAIHYIGTTAADTACRHYALPDNVVALRESHLYERLPPRELKSGSLSRGRQAACLEALRGFYLAASERERIPAFWRLTEALEQADDRFTFGNLCQDPSTWDLLLEVYERTAADESFIDFFWTSRFVHLPVWWTWLARREIPAARVYHAVSTGFAGFLGALAARRHQAPYLITEHGIYTRERLLEITQAGWIHEPEPPHFSYEQGLGQLKRLWIGLFTFLGLLSYEAADSILTLYPGHRRLQTELGARPEKIRVVPNGVDPDEYAAAYDARQERRRHGGGPPIAGFIGRIVPIKDIKTLLRAARLLVNQLPEVEFLLAGPTTEDPDYFAECQELTRRLGLEGRVRFLGMRQIADVLPLMDALVLTSLSEGMPLVILEAFAAGVPVVATEVGACRDLIFGESDPDKRLGQAGFITRTLAPVETAQAMCRLLGDRALNRQLGDTGRQRVATFYRRAAVFDAYRALYTEYGGHRV